MSQTALPIIAPFKTGLQTDIQPWLASPDSFSEIDNFHVEHGYLERRNGYKYLTTTANTQLTNKTPVTGFSHYIETATGISTNFAFDTKSAYRYNGATQSFTQLVNSVGASPIIMTGINSNYVMSASWLSTGASYINRLYFTNGKPLSGGLDGIWRYDNVTPTKVTAFTPSIGGGVTVRGAKLIFTLGQRMVLLNTYESGGNTRYPQRARWCAKANPSNWDDTVAGGGDYADAATADQILSAQILQNRLIVFFTNSVWSLLPTSDPNKAFRWQKINDFRSCNGKMASVSYDSYINTVGTRGIAATDGVNTKRIDDNISDFVNSNIDQANIELTFCFRDYTNQRWWTLYPSKDTATNNKALIFDDESGAFSTYSINMSALGYLTPGYDWAWDDFTVANSKDFSFEDFNNDETFDSEYFQANMAVIVGGDEDGFIYLLETGNTDLVLDVPSGLYVPKEISASFTTAAWNPYYQEGSESVFPYIDFYLESSPTASATISFYKDTDEIPYTSQDIDFLPNLDFVSAITAIDQSNPCKIYSVENGLSTGDEIYIYRIEGMTEVNSTEFAAAHTITVVDDDSFTLDTVDSTPYTAYSGGGGIYKREYFKTKVWKRAYGGGTGYQHKIGFTSNDNDSAFRVHGYKPIFKKRGKRLIN